MPPLPSHESTRSVAPPPSPDAPDLSPGVPPQSDAAADRAARADLAHGTEESVAAQLGDSAALNQAASLSPFAPLSVPVFRMLWLTWVAANTCMWMNDVAAAWLMTTLTTSPVLVALVQTASTLPVFLLGLPSGALADILDRRRYFIATQFWVAAVALVLCVAILAGGMTAPLLLALTFANGIGLAMRWPVFAAIVPELVSRPQLPAALALNGVAMNASRIIGPLLAGAIIASAGSAWVFVLNAVLSIVSGLVIMRWKRVHTPSPLGRERLTSAMRVGLQFVRQSPRMRAVLWRISIFFLHATALLALLPLLAKGLEGGGAGTFTLLLASMGAGAITAAMFLPRLRQALARDVRGGHGVDHHGQLAVGVGPARAAQLGARARHVHLPDGHHGLHRAGRRRVGPGGHGHRCACEPGHCRRHRRGGHAAGAAPGGRPQHGGGPEPLARLQGARGRHTARIRAPGGHHRILHRPRPRRLISRRDAGKPQEPPAP